ncbi:MAG: cold-shock protein [Proteobacteria bacterium]|nr:MAG: cold-shock protein [Pseudomonadota bacterium]
MPSGKVKWFNNAKGYGFIIEDGESEDLFAHFSSIQTEGYRTLKAGQTVTFEKQPSGKGMHAVNIFPALETGKPANLEANNKPVGQTEVSGNLYELGPKKAVGA